MSSAAAVGQYVTAKNFKSPANAARSIVGQPYRRTSLPCHWRLQAQQRAGVFGQLAGSLWGSPKPATPEPEAEDVDTEQDSEIDELDQLPAPTDVFADPLPGDSEDVAPLRQLLAQTRLEKAPLRLAYDAQRDGWSPESFHAGVDGCGAALVVALTAGGAVLGGYNPVGWDGQGQDKDSLSAFLYIWTDGDISARPLKLPKVGGPERAVIRDEPGQGVWFGPDGLIIPLCPTNETAAKGKLGASYSRKPDGGRHLFAEGSPVKGGARGTQLVSLRVYVAGQQ